MERSRKTTPIFKRSKGAFTLGLVILGCAIFGVGGAVAGDGKYARHVHQARLEARFARAALAHRTPEQLILAITPKAHHKAAHARPSAHARGRARKPAAVSTPAPTVPATPAPATPAPASTLTDTTAQPTVSTPAAPTPPTPAATTTTPATTTVTGSTPTTTTTQAATAAPAPATVVITPVTTGATSNLSAGATGPSNATAAVTVTPVTTDSQGRPAKTGTTTTGTPGVPGASTTDATGTATITPVGNGRPSLPGGTSTSSTSGSCHGRCSTSTPNPVPASLPSTTSPGGSAFSLTIPSSTSATTPPPVITTPTENVSSGALPLTPTPAATSTPSTQSSPSTPATPLGSFPSLQSTSGIKRLSHHRARSRSSHTAPVTRAVTAPTAPTARTATTRATAPAGGTLVAAAPVATKTTAAKTPPAHARKTPKHQVSGGTGLPSEVVTPVIKFVGFIPTAVWVALGAAFALALIFAGIALRAGRRARRREREFKAISAAAATDALTGILNRRGFMDAADRELARASRYDRPFVLAYVDVRGLKGVNDTEGHLVGDELIKTVAGLMKESARADDVVGRIGGDEFALLLDEQTAEGAEPVLRRIRSRVEERRAAMEIRVPWELTIGIAAFPKDGTTLEELIGTADRRLYEQRGIALR